VIIKALRDHNFNPKDIIINIPTSTLVSSANKIVYSRSNKETPIDLNELDYIIAKAEKKALEDAKREITKKTGYLEVDMKLITSSITSIKIDNFQVSNPIGFTGENVVLSTLNIFIPSSRYNLIQMIGNYLGKNILSIIPLEFSLPKLLES
jgi:cell division ATPase FtsA